jgi:hypothetical protein
VRDAAQRGEMAPIDKLAGRQGPVRFTAGCRLVSRGAAHWSRDASYAPAVAGQAKQAVRVSFFLSRRSLAVRARFLFVRPGPNGSPSWDPRRWPRASRVRSCVTSLPSPGRRSARAASEEGTSRYARTNTGFSPLACLLRISRGARVRTDWSLRNCSVACSSTTLPALRTWGSP